jgi:hypothetical protein
MFSLVVLFSGIGYPAEWIMHGPAGSRGAPGVDEGDLAAGSSERTTIWSGGAVGGSYGSVPATAPSEDIFLCPHDPESPMFLDFIWPKLLMLFASCVLVVLRSCLLHAELFGPAAHITAISFFLNLLDTMLLVFIVAWLWALSKVTFSQCYSNYILEIIISKLSTYFSGLPHGGAPFRGGLLLLGVRGLGRGQTRAGERSWSFVRVLGDSASQVSGDNSQPMDTLIAF